MSLPEISVQELKALLDANAEVVIVDVRDQWEADIGNINGRLIPLRELPNHFQELDPNALTVVHCQMGGRSSRATQFLLDHGFTNVKNLKGGLQAWVNEIDPNVKLPK